MNGLKKIMYRNVTTTVIHYIVKNYNCSTMLIQSCYAAATVKLQSLMKV